ncbi:MAG: hypothetical protein WCW17_00160 [Patescibacteria group bacterium]|jgi:hypothetical protein
MKHGLLFKHKRLFLIILITIIIFGAVGVGIVFAIEYRFSQNNLSLANSSMNYLESSQLKLKANYLESKNTVAQKTAEINAKNVELSKAKADLDKTKSELSKIEKQVADQRQQILNQQEQLSSNASELSTLRNRPPLFSFQNKSSKNVDQAKSDVETVVKAAYDKVSEVYSMPYLLHSITISFVDSLSKENASGEIHISNGAEGLEIEIRITGFDKNSFQSVNTIIHEIVHSFHGLATLDPVAFEEGMTVAASDKIMRELGESGSLPKFSNYYVQISDSQYNNYNGNSSFSIPSDYNNFYSDNAYLYYQLEGYAWQKLANSNPDFYKNFNEKFYNKIRNGQKASNDLVKETIKEVASSVDGQSIDSYFSSNKAFAL